MTTDADNLAAVCKALGWEPKETYAAGTFGGTPEKYLIWPDLRTDPALVLRAAEIAGDMLGFCSIQRTGGVWYASCAKLGSVYSAPTAGEAIFALILAEL